MEKYEEIRQSADETHVHRIKKDTIQKLELFLYVDNREVRSKTDRNYVFDNLVKSGLKCKTLPLPLGDFLWIAEVHLLGNQKPLVYTLDYIAERKTADDLGSSIVDGRYNQQKFRLSNSKIKNIFYIVEGRATQHAAVQD
jgi:crossover junction endonuclease MUS81